MEDFLQFVDASPTAFHAAEEIGKRLKAKGFTALDEAKKWKLEWGGSYFVMRGGSLVAAFVVPKSDITSALILASHTDSPALKIKPQPEVASRGIGQLSTECYGSPLLHSWLDRELCLAGRIVTRDLKAKLVCLDEHPLVIPSLALHLDRSISEKGLQVHKQDHLKAIFSLSSKKTPLDFEKLLAFDLFLTPMQKASFIGAKSEMIASYRLDNLTSVYASLFAMLHAKPKKSALQMSFFWDHEEIGSETAVGAGSSFANELLIRICQNLKMDSEEIFRMKSQSLCLSSDLAHGFHPNFADKYDPQNAPLLGEGVVIKFNANQKYATSSLSAAEVLAAAKKHKIATQLFAGRSDISSGSTVGSIMAAKLGISTIDLGISGWAMHSARETVSTKDLESLCRLLQAALSEISE